MEEKMLTAIEIMDIQKTIEEINRILYSIPFRTDEACAKICEVNTKHPENMTVHNLLFSHGQTSIPIASAGDELLKEDLSWKRYYLNAKCAEKAVDEMWEKMYGRK